MLLLDRKVGNPERDEAGDYHSDLFYLTSDLLFDWYRLSKSNKRTGWGKLSDGWESDPVNIVTNWDISSESDDPCFVVGLVDTSIHLYDCLNPSWTRIHGSSFKCKG